MTKKRKEKEKMIVEEIRPAEGWYKAQRQSLKDAAVEALLYATVYVLLIALLAMTGILD